MAFNSFRKCCFELEINHRFLLQRNESHAHTQSFFCFLIGCFHWLPESQKIVEGKVSGILFVHFFFFFFFWGGGGGDNVDNIMAFNDKF